jgi:[ribosomal protein S18]-alanine N-acetyltransferase
MIRPYRASDMEAILELIRQNTPNYFDPSEEKLLASYLKDRTEDYFVVEVGHEIIGGGGIDFEDDGSGTISWGMIHPSWHGKGWGSKLTQYRIELLKKSRAKKINVRTSQHTWKFYEKMGFTLFHSEKDYWGKGLDLYDMEMRLV